MNDVREIRPPSVMDHIEKRQGEQLPAAMYDKIHEIFSEFSYDMNLVEDITRYVFDSDVETALSDSVSMYCFFMHCENAMREKEEFLDDKIKLMLAKKETTAKTVTERKGEVRGSDEYQKLFKVLLRYRRIRRNCEDMKEAMKFRMSVAQTRSANNRLPMLMPWLSPK